MGLGSSRLGAGSLTRTELLKSTESGRDFVNNLFQVMLSKLTPEDFLKLSKTTSCSTFVFVMADSIGKLFQDLRVRPMRGKDSGVVYFQKIDKLKEQTSDSRQLCLIIAYFYVRIFQIFGALAMSVVDDPSAGAVLGILQYRPPMPVQKPGFFGRAPARIPGARGAMFGGAEARFFLTVNGRKFEPIRELLADPVQFQIGRESAKPAFQFNEKPDLYLLPDRTGQNLYLNLGDTNTYLLAQLELSTPIRQADGTYKMTMSIKNFKVQDPALDATGLATVNNYIKTEAYQHKLISADRKLWDAESASFIDTLSHELDKVIKHKDEYQRDPEAAAKRAARRRVAGIPAAIPGVVPGVGVGAVEAGVPKALQNQYIIQTLKAMTGYKTTSFCVARALQLLDAKSLYEPKPMEATSGVCVAKFDSLPTSVPESGKPITSVPGLRALDQLYSVNPHVIKDGETAFSKPEPEYADFLQKFAGLFGRPSATAKLAGLDSVLAKDPNCPATAVKHYLKIQDPRGIQNVLGIVKQMFGRQLGHTKRVLEFFKTKLFIFKKIKDPITGGQRTWIDIHPKLLQGGIQELEILSKEARAMLVGYYSGCEELYQKGVQAALATKMTPI